MTWYQVVDGATEQIDPGYVVLSGARTSLDKIYVVRDGRRELFYPVGTLTSFDVTEAAQFLDEVIVEPVPFTEYTVEELLTAAERVAVSKIIDLAESATFTDEVIVEPVPFTEHLVEELIQASEGVGLDKIVEATEAAQFLDEVTVEEIPPTEYLVEELVQASEAISRSVQSAPAQPTNVSASWDSSACTVTVTWTDNATTEDEYRVERDGVTIATGLSPDTEIYEDFGANANDSHDYRVAACNSVGCTWSALASVQTGDCLNGGA